VEITEDRVKYSQEFSGKNPWSKLGIKGAGFSSYRQETRSPIFKDVVPYSLTQGCFLGSPVFRAYRRWRLTSVQQGKGELASNLVMILHRRRL